ncbi:MAG: hypothetical protein ABIJ56_08430 [Pseudomonadota bacterium]
MKNPLRPLASSVFMTALVVLCCACGTDELDPLWDADADAAPWDAAPDVLDAPAEPDGYDVFDVGYDDVPADVPLDVPVDLPPDIPADPVGDVVPPMGGSSGGSGGDSPVSGSTRSAGGISYYLIVPSSYSPSVPNPFMIIFSGTEGGATMTSNMLSIAPYTGIDNFIFAILDGPTYYGNGAAGEPVIDDVRARYNIDNDKTYLISESAGTRAGLQLGFQLRQSYFAAYWANDVNASGSPSQAAAELGFAPWGNAGPGGDYPDANAIVNAMRTAGYRLPADAPYSGPGAGTHGSTEQFMAACRFFPGKSRQP